MGNVVSVLVGSVNWREFGCNFGSVVRVLVANYSLGSK